MAHPMANGRTTIWLQPEGLRIPGNLASLEDFRAWARSGEFPQEGRIDWIAGGIEIDISPEELNTHGSPKGAIYRGLGDLIETTNRGVVYVDSTRVSSSEADLSAEPDIVVLLFESVRTGRVKLVAKSRAPQGRFGEIEGPPDLVVECVSDTSVERDETRLRDAYHRARVPEYWIVDARGDNVSLRVLVHAGRTWRQLTAGAEGFIESPLLGCRVRLVRLPAQEGLLRYRLETRGD